MKTMFIGTMILLGTLTVFFTPAPAVEAQVVGPTQYPRFWMSDYTEVGGGVTSFMLHDNKLREVCFLVTTKEDGGIAMTPRAC